MTEQGESAARIMRDISNTAERLARRMGGEFIPYGGQASAAGESERNPPLPINYLNERPSR